MRLKNSWKANGLTREELYVYPQRSFCRNFMWRAAQMERVVFLSESHPLGPQGLLPS